MNALLTSAAICPCALTLMHGCLDFMRRLCSKNSDNTPLMTLLKIGAFNKKADSGPFSVIIVLAIVNSSMIRYLPWLKSDDTKFYQGYPNLVSFVAHSSAPSAHQC